MSATVRLGGVRRGPVTTRARSRDRYGDALLRTLCTAAALLALVVIVGIVYQVVHGAHESISHFGLGFLTSTAWDPQTSGRLGAGTFLFGTAVTSVATLCLAVPLGVAIGLYLSTIAPRRVSGVIGPLVELLAAIPSVILGFWGILVLGPFVRSHLEPFLHKTLGVLPIFGAAQTTGTGLFTATLILTIMVLPIVASISRDLFATVPRGAAGRRDRARGDTLGDGARRDSPVDRIGGRRCVVPRARSRARRGDRRHAGSRRRQRNTRLTVPAGRHAGEPHRRPVPGGDDQLLIASLFYLGLILLFIELLTNIAAQLIARRFDVRRSLAR